MHRAERPAPIGLLGLAGLIVCGASFWLIVGFGARPASATAGYEVRSTTTTQNTTAFSHNVTARGHKGGPVAVILSFVGVIAVVVLIVALGSMSVRRRTRDNPTPRWWKGRGPPDGRKGLFG